MGHPNVARKKDVEYWDYWAEMVKASVMRDTHELPAIAAAAQIKGKHVMDVGCGPGRLILPFSALAATITAVDESDWTVKVCEKLVYEHRLRERVQVVQAPLVGLPFDDSVSESTYCLWVIHHDKSRWDKIVKEMVRVTIAGAPIVVGFASGEKDLPQLEELVKPDYVRKCREFDKEFSKWCEEQGWNLTVKKVPLSFVFKSPEWAQEVFMNTFMRRDVPAETHAKILHFLKTHVKNGKCIIEQELRLYVIREEKE